MKTKNHDFVNICGEWINLNEVRKIVVSNNGVYILFIDGTACDIYSGINELKNMETVKEMLNKRLNKLM